MRYLNYLKHITLLLLSFAIVNTSYAASASPVEMLDGVAKQVISSLDKHRATLKSKPDVVYQIVDGILLPYVDVTGMSRSVLGRNAWKNATVEEKKRFSQEFTRLVVRTYSGALTEYSGEKVKFFPLASGYESNPFVQVKSAIVRSGGRQISLSYKLVRKGDDWKIYDMGVEGVSLLQSFRSQFAAELTHGNLSQLIDTLAKRNAEAKRSS